MTTQKIVNNAGKPEFSEAGMHLVAELAPPERE
jgi:hypothetical protein